MKMRALKAALGVAGMLVAVSAFADNRPRQPDNSGINERDKKGETVTSFDQSTRESDQEITRKIRVAINNEERLSVNAHNVKIITDDSGQVVLRGPVASDKERTEVERLAREVASNRTIVNRLEVAPSSKK